MSKTIKAILAVVLILLIDQVIKIYVKTHMEIGNSICVFGNCENVNDDGWFTIKFIENPGMAFGMDIPGPFGKIILTLFRITAVGGIVWYLRKLIQKNANNLLIISVAMILAGAMGNILDSVFYGMIFDYGTVYNEDIHQWVYYSGQASMNFEGYAPPFKGCVVDMLYFPLIEGHYPDWMPFGKGGDKFIFFRPIFNIADSAISIGVALILLFQRRLFKEIA